MMTRLTKQIKKEMVEELIRHGKFDNDIATKQSAIKAQGDKIWHFVFDKYAEPINALPERMIMRASYIRLSGIDDPFSKSHFSNLKIELTTYRPTLAHNQDIYSEIHGLSNDSPLIINYIQAKQNLQDAELKLKQAIADAQAILNSCNTFKQLWDAWAECRPVLEKFEHQGEVIYPIAKPIQTLNAAFGLDKTND